MVARRDVWRHLALALVTACLGLPAMQAADSEQGHPRILTEKSDRESISLERGQELRVRLSGQAGTGYSWELTKKPDKILKQLGDSTQEQAQDGPRVGGPVVTVFRFKALAVGSGDLKLQYRRPFEKEAKPAKTFQVKITVKERQ
jgi:inhibitor of cysteine peptidase